MFNEKDRQRFLEAWKGLGAKAEDGPGVFVTVKAMYANPQRKYHTAARIQGFLEELDEVRHRLGDPELVEMGIILSNIIFDPQLSSGREFFIGANFARELLYSAGADAERAEGVYNLIVAMRDPFIVPESDDAKTALDILLSPLGAPQEKFDENTRLIKEEYPMETDEVFLKLQANQVHAFLQHPPIFRTPYFNKKYGEQAMGNIMRLCNNAITL